ncbi:hypothetical protein JOQ06_015961 [Pogonophryne albipinna]|uniref:Uncharacterized protein n=1 Tax=Pogonophryne albipinna TaxID=1090488 RepID=A0AAD6ANV2_9TELE|nr:hypothetical protein JOQ06_015961 [Pogonophryne albipinna]
MNATMRRIDQETNILPPLAVGQVMTLASCRWLWLHPGLEPCVSHCGVLLLVTGVPHRPCSFNQSTGAGGGSGVLAEDREENVTSRAPALESASRFVVEMWICPSNSFHQCVDELQGNGTSVPAHGKTTRRLENTPDDVKPIYCNHTSNGSEEFHQLL